MKQNDYKNQLKRLADALFVTMSIKKLTPTESPYLIFSSPELKIFSSPELKPLTDNPGAATEQSKRVRRLGMDRRHRPRRLNQRMARRPPKG
jgi:hypothetical protein